MYDAILSVPFKIQQTPKSHVCVASPNREVDLFIEALTGSIQFFRGLGTSSSGDAFGMDDDFVPFI